MKRAWSLAAVVFVCFSTRTALADPDTQRARALFDEAGELERHGQWSAAQERLRAALRLRETPQLYYALGWALESDDKLLEAKQEYETALKYGRERTGNDEVVRLAASRIADVDKKLARIRVHLTGTAASRAGARVMIDGVELRHEDDSALAAVNPGTHVVRVERGTAPAVEEMVYVGRGAVESLDVSTDPAVAARDTAQERHAATTTVKGAAAAGRGDSALPYLLLAGGAAGVVGGGALLIASADASSTSPMQTAGFSLGGVGLVSAAVGVVLLYVVKGDSTRERTKPQPARLVRASIAPLNGGAFGSAALSF